MFSITEINSHKIGIIPSLLMSLLFTITFLSRIINVTQLILDILENIEMHKEENECYLLFCHPE